MSVIAVALIACGCAAIVLLLLGFPFCNGRNPANACGDTRLLGDGLLRAYCRLGYVDKPFNIGDLEVFGAQADMDALGDAIFP